MRTTRLASARRQAYIDILPRGSCMTALEINDAQTSAPRGGAADESWLHKAAHEAWRFEAKISDMSGVSPGSINTSLGLVAAAVVLPELGGKALSMVSREIGSESLARLAATDADKIALEAAEKRAAETFPGNDRARQLLLKQATEALSDKEQQEVYHLYTSQRRGPELNQLLARYFSDDPAVHLLDQDKAQKVVIDALDKNDHTFITQNLAACKASLTVVDGADGARTAVFTHFQPGMTSENLSQLKNLLPRLGNNETTAAPRVFMFVPEGEGWPVQYKSSMFSPTKTAQTTAEATQVLVDNIESTLGRKVNLTVSRYPGNFSETERLGEKGTVRLTVPGDRAKPINFKTWYDDLDLPKTH